MFYLFNVNKWKPHVAPFLITSVIICAIRTTEYFLAAWSSSFIRAKSSLILIGTSSLHMSIIFSRHAWFVGARIPGRIGIWIPISRQSLTKFIRTRESKHICVMIKSAPASTCKYLKTGILACAGQFPSEYY